LSLVSYAINNSESKMVPMYSVNLRVHLSMSSRLRGLMARAQLAS